MKIRVVYGVRLKEDFISAVFDCPKDAHDFVKTVLNRDDTVLLDYRIMEEDDQGGGEDL